MKSKYEYYIKFSYDLGQGACVVNLKCPLTYQSQIKGLENDIMEKQKFNDVNIYDYILME